MSATESTGHEPQLWLLRRPRPSSSWCTPSLINLVLLTLGFFLRLFGASTDAEFTRWVYRNVDRIMEPFRGIFPSHAVSDVSVLDVCSCSPWSCTRSSPSRCTPWSHG